MIPLLLLALAAPAASPSQPAPACSSLAGATPERALAAAEQWRLRGGIDARHCLGLAYSAAQRWDAAAAAFEEAAAEAETKKDARSAGFRAQAGNAWLAAGDAGRARKAFDAALAATGVPAELRGEVHLDRARAAAAGGDFAGARIDIDKGLALVPADPFAWYLSAALARREGDLGRAAREISKAVELAPDDARVLVEAGNIAGLSGELEEAKTLFARAAKAAPDSEAGRAAQAALAANSGTAQAPPAAAPPQPK